MAQARGSLIGAAVGLIIVALPYVSDLSACVVQFTAADYITFSGP